MTKILVIDEGTSSTRAAIYNENLERGEFAQNEVALISPRPEIVEQDANAIWLSSLEMAKRAAGANIPDAIGITNQRETSILWEKSTGKPVHNALVWQDRRGSEFCDFIKTNGIEKDLIAKTGLVADAYFSGFKLWWLFKNIDGLKSRAMNGEILFGNVDTWLIYNLSGKHLTDFSNASRTALFNIIKGEWDEELLSLFEIPRAILPEVISSNGDFGTTTLFGGKTKITGVLGDQQAALMGQNCKEPGEAKITFGTGAFLMAALGATPKYSNNKMLLTISSNISGQTNYALEGAVLNAGTAIKWLRDELGLIANASESEQMANSLSDNGGVYFVPAFTGLGAPHWRSDAKGTISGLGRGTTKEHIVRAALEASAYQTHDLLNAIEKDSDRLKVLRIDGGMTNNDFFCQFLADICNIEVQRPNDLEMTAMGAARIALMGLGIDAGAKKMAMKSFHPSCSVQQRQNNLAGWEKALKATLV